jgi:uncharacterized protein YrrD
LVECGVVRWGTRTKSTPPEKKGPMLRSAKELVGIDVVSLEDAARVGRTDGLVVDRARREVAGFVIDVGFREAKALSFEDICTVHEESIMVRSADAVRPLSAQPRLREMADRGLSIDGLPALDDAGDRVGTVVDYFVDVASGAIARLAIDPSDEQGARSIPADRLLGIGDELVLVLAAGGGRS